MICFACARRMRYPQKDRLSSARTGASIVITCATPGASTIAQATMTLPNQRRAMLVLLVLSGLIISLCMGLRQSLGLFMRPMTLELGISAATFGFSIALQNIVWGLSQPFVGALADRYGPRPVLVATAFTYAAGLLLMLEASAFPGALHI